MVEVAHERCCGLDVHKKTVVACVIGLDGRETRAFGTMTDDLERLAEGLEHCGVTHVAMESTGVVSRDRAGPQRNLHAHLLLRRREQGRSHNARDDASRAEISGGMVVAGQRAQMARVHNVIAMKAKGASGSVLATVHDDAIVALPRTGEPSA